MECVFLPAMILLGVAFLPLVSLALAFTYVQMWRLL